MFEKTLIPVAYGERPEEMRTIGRVLKGLGARSISLFHVNESGSLFRGSDLSWLMLLKEALEEVGLSVEVETGEGHTASAIAEAALLDGADEIYMKTKRRWHIETMLLGSVSRDLLRLSDVPVFVHKVRPCLPDGEGTINPKDLIVLYATDLDEASARPLPYVMDLRGSRCHILHVRRRMADPVSEKVQGGIIGRELLKLAVEIEPFFEQVTTEQKIGNPGTVVLRVSDLINADIIVLGRRTAALGDTAEMIVTGSRASIFLVP